MPNIILYTKYKNYDERTKRFETQIRVWGSIQV